MYCSDILNYDILFGIARETYLDDYLTMIEVRPDLYRKREMLDRIKPSIVCKTEGNDVECKVGRITFKFEEKQKGILKTYELKEMCIGSVEMRFWERAAPLISDDTLDIDCECSDCYNSCGCGQSEFAASFELTNEEKKWLVEETDIKIYENERIKRYKEGRINLLRYSL